MSNNNFSNPHNVKMTYHTKNTKVTFKITIRNRHVYIAILYVKYENCNGSWVI